MIKSMTGFGDAATQDQAVHYALELRSLNNKYFKAAIRLPEELAGLEAELEAALRKRVSRGSFTLTVKYRVSDAAAASKVNEAALMEYLAHLETVQDRVTGHDVHIDLTQLLAMPGVLQPALDDESLLHQARPVVLGLLGEAVDRLTLMREREGRALAEDLLHQRACILERIERVQRRSPQVIEEYHARLRGRVDELLARAQLQVNESDLIREVALFADRSDISEELQRVRGHLDQFEQIIDAGDGEPAGRTLDFLAQELLREANTLGSKSNDATISRAVVEVKSAIDRIKEQVQNVE